MRAVGGCRSGVFLFSGEFSGYGREYEYVSLPFSCCALIVLWGVVVLIVLTMVDYASAVIGAMLVLGIGNWFFHARGCYHGPRLE